MATKSTETLPTVDIKGSAYVLVKDRVTYFNEKYPEGMIRTKLISNEGGQVVVKAIIVPDWKQPSRYFTGYSQAVEGQGIVNKTAALENAETSAVGRALAFMGIGVIDSIASADEIHKATAPAPKRELPIGMTQKDADDINEVLAETERKCAKCGQPAVLKEGMSQKTGKYWKAYFCSTGEKSHAEFLS